MSAENSAPSSHLELFVKAGKDGESYGACPLCQRMFMILLLKANQGELTFTVTTVNMAKPPPDFKKISSRLPVVVHGTEIISDPDEMIQYIDANFPYPPLQYDNVKSHQSCLEVFSKFSYYIKDVSHSPAGLISELRKINKALEQNGSKFLAEDYMTHLDCMMLPKLQHIRVASKAFKNFEFPEDLTFLWRYLGRCYESDVFRKTCPSDQEVVHHWTTKPELSKLGMEKELLYSTETPPRYSHQIPDSAKE